MQQYQLVHLNGRTASPEAATKETTSPHHAIKLGLDIHKERYVVVAQYDEIQYETKRRIKMARIIPLRSFALEIVDGVTDGVPIEGEVTSFSLDISKSRFSVIRESDEFSVFLAQMLFSGEVLDKVSILVQTAVEDAVLTRQLFIFADCIITGTSTSGRGGSATEQVTFEFKSFQIAIGD